MKLYHGTSENNAQKILQNGFDLPMKSPEFFLGRGVYFSHTPEKARTYGLVVLETDLNISVCRVSHMEGIGIFPQWAKVECDDVGNINCCNLDETCFQQYVEFAENERQQRLSEGCPVIDDGRQVVIFDEQILKSLSPVRVGTI